MRQNSEIDWEPFDKILVKLEKDKEKILKLTEWHTDNRFQRPGIRFTVIEEDNKQVSKEFMTTSRRLITKLKPIIEIAEAKGKEHITVSITKTGDGFEANFIVKDLT